MTRTEQALIQDAERERAASKARVASERLGMRARTNAIRELRTGGDLIDVIEAASRPFDGFTEELLDSMVFAHLLGVRRTDVNATAAGAELSDPIPLSATAAAIAKIFRKASFRRGDVQKLRQRYAFHAQKVVQEQTAFVMKKLTVALQKAGRVPLQKGVEVLRRAFRAAGVTPGENYQLATLYRTQTQLAYQAGRLLTLEEYGEDVWGFEYVTQRDDRVRPEHDRMDGFKAPKDDPVWMVWTPPNGYNCRCDLLEIWGKARRSRREVGLPDPGFAFSPVELLPGAAGRHG